MTNSQQPEPEKSSSRQIVLDTETTGIDPKEHRIIEIGCVELINRELTGKTFHYYLQPDREVEAGAFAVHGISTEMLADKPRFKDILQEFISFVDGGELVIHNAPFDIGHLNAELARVPQSVVTTPFIQTMDEICSVLDTLVMARKKHAGQRNSLDALCKRYQIDNTQRSLHGALLDAQILAEVYLAMTGGQTELNFGLSQAVDTSADDYQAPTYTLDTNRKPYKTIPANQAELTAHDEMLELLATTAGKALW